MQEIVLRVIQAEARDFVGDDDALRTAWINRRTQIREGVT